MSKNKRTKTRDSYESIQESESNESFDENDLFRLNYSCSDNDLSDENTETECSVSKVSYRHIFNSYTENQKKLEPDHVFSWTDGENIIPFGDIDDKLLLSDTVKSKISSMSPVNLFELFFSDKIKNYIIESSKLNSLQLSMKELNCYIGIILFSSFNMRRNILEYWETDPLVHCTAVSSVMSRNRFMEIKSKIRYSKPTDEDAQDKAWRVRSIINLFRQNIQQFGFFCTALSVDEMMAPFFGRTSLKQYLPCKPDRYGIKLWGLCATNGYLFNLDVYCGKNDSSVGMNLSSCALGSRVVLQMVHPLLNQLSRLKLADYHLYFDNFFTSPDLVLHLKKCGLRSTGTVRQNRIVAKHIFEKNAPRGSYRVSSDSNSGINFVSVIDSKQVSILSSAVGVTPMKAVERFSRNVRQRTEIPFPLAFSIYNINMGGVDLHDFRCKKVAPSMKSKKWTWPILVRVLESSITNAIILWNLCNSDDLEMRSRDLCKEVCRVYLSKSSDLSSHKHESRIRSSCTHRSCKQRTTRFCIDCNRYICLTCFPQIH